MLRSRLARLEAKRHTGDVSHEMLFNWLHYGLQKHPRYNPDAPEAEQRALKRETWNAMYGATHPWPVAKGAKE